MRKKIIVFAGFILMTVVFSTFRCFCFGGGGDEFYDLKSIDANLKHVVGTELWVDTVPYIHRLVLEDIYHQDDTISIAFDSLAIMVKTSYYKLPRKFNGNIHGIQLAHATPSILIIYESITDIIITSNKNYNAKYPAESNLKEIITVGQDWSSSVCRVDENITLDSLTIDFPWRLNNGFPRMLYLFNTPPDTEEVHEITIKYITEKGQMVSTVIKNIKILK
jgi:hypothetical protein